MLLLEMSKPKKSYKRKGIKKKRRTYRKKHQSAGAIDTYVPGQMTIDNHTPVYPPKEINNLISHVIFINLDKRKDRRKHIERELAVFEPSKVTRLAAVEDPSIHPTTGCAKSHLKALQMARDNKYPNILIVEDDAYWNKVDETYPILERLMKQPYDGIMLGSINADYDKETYLLRSALSTTAYIVNQAFYPKVIELFEQALSKYDPKIHSDKEIITTADGIIRDSHGIGTWYIVAPSIMMQVPSYSDITHKNEDKIFSNSRELFT